MKKFLLSSLLLATLGFTFSNAKAEEGSTNIYQSIQVSGYNVEGPMDSKAYYNPSMFTDFTLSKGKFEYGFGFGLDKISFYTAGETTNINNTVSNLNSSNTVIPLYLMGKFNIGKKFSVNAKLGWTLNGQQKDSYLDTNDNESQEQVGLMFNLSGSYKISELFYVSLEYTGYNSNISTLTPNQGVTSIGYHIEEDSKMINKVGISITYKLK